MARRVDDKILAALPTPERERFLQDLNRIVKTLGTMTPTIPVKPIKD
jgi:hypothetical protein